MKRNHTNNRVKRSGVSPYAKYGKRPSVYPCSRRDGRNFWPAIGPVVEEQLFQARRMAAARAKRLEELARLYAELADI